MVSPRRVLAVTAGLILTGMVVGALCAGVALALVMAARGQWRAVFDPALWALAAAVGGAIGSVAAPLMSWLFLRRVPLGRAIVQTALGTIIGGAVTFPMFLGPLGGALLGFSAAALRLFVVTRVPERRRLRLGDPPA
jgi:hypothetical protein